MASFLLQFSDPLAHSAMSAEKESAYGEENPRPSAGGKEKGRTAGDQQTGGVSGGKLGQRGQDDKSSE